MPSKKKTLEKKTRGKKTRPPKRPSQGLFGKTLLEKLKTAPPGASDDAILMETLRSVPVHQVKAALKEVEPKERNLLSAARADRRAAGVHSHHDLPERPLSARGKGSELVAEVQRGFDDRAHLAAS